MSAFTTFVHDDHKVGVSLLRLEAFNSYVLRISAIAAAMEQSRLVSDTSEVTIHMTPAKAAELIGMLQNLVAPEMEVING